MSSHHTYEGIYSIELKSGNTICIKAPTEAAIHITSVTVSSPQYINTKTRDSCPVITISAFNPKMKTDFCLAHLSPYSLTSLLNQVIMPSQSLVLKAVATPATTTPATTHITGYYIPAALAVNRATVPVVSVVSATLDYRAPPPNIYANRGVNRPPKDSDSEDSDEEERRVRRRLRGAAHAQPRKALPFGAKPVTPAKLAAKPTVTPAKQTPQPSGASASIQSSQLPTTPMVPKVLPYGAKAITKPQPPASALTPNNEQSKKRLREDYSSSEVKGNAGAVSSINQKGEKVLITPDGRRLVRKKIAKKDEKKPGIVDKALRKDEVEGSAKTLASKKRKIMKKKN